MEDPCSVNSPRRVLSLSRKRKGNLSFPEPDDDKGSGFGPSGGHGPKPLKCMALLAPSQLLFLLLFSWYGHIFPSLGYTLLGSFIIRAGEYWALAVPTYAMVTIVLAIVFYIGLTPTSLNTIFDDYSREPSSFEPSVEGDEQPIEPLSDIGIDQINDLMFSDRK